MLNKACAVHPVNVCQRDRFLVRLIDTHMDEADIVIEAVTEDYRRNIRDDCSRVKVSSPVSLIYSLGARHVPKHDFD